MKDYHKIKQQQRKRRQVRVRAKISGTAERPRLSVFRSLKHIYAQLINDEMGRTLVTARDTELKNKTKKTLKVEIAKEVGSLLAEKALKDGLKKAIFDRSGYRYHGRVKSLAEGAREGGLEF